MKPRVVGFALLVCVVAWGSEVAAAPCTVALSIGANISPHVAARLRAYVADGVERGAGSGETCGVVDAIDDSVCEAADFCLALGNTTLEATRRLIPLERLQALGPEGFAVQGGTSSGSNASGVVLAADGNPGNVLRAPGSAMPGRLYGNIGAHYAAYAALEVIGFAFFHPLDPVKPNGLRLSGAANLSMDKAPQWPVRSWHYHTEHPLEITEVLNGWNATGTGYNESWASMVDNADSYFEWVVANRQNRLEWVLLWAKDWADFANSTTRKRRMQQLTTIGHDYGLFIGADIPIAEVQQHAWYMVTQPNAPEATTQAEIRARVDWFVSAGFDFLNTENGFSEFTHPSDTLMVGWLNYTTSYLRDTYGLPASIKCHCSSGQTCKHYNDPRTGMPLNFNFLPIYADKGLGIQPHTVQVYSYDDPSGGTYGHSNFSAMFDFLEWQAKLGEREVVFHPESAYWVGYDINVPLFLGPLYAQRRLRDLRHIHSLETAHGWKMHGQNVFESGWEWSYWIGNVVTARAAWDPQLKASTDDDALRAALGPIGAAFDGSAGSAGPGAEIVDLIVSLAAAEEALLVLGETKSPPPAVSGSRKYENGMAYVVGWDAISDLERFAGDAMTSPDRVALQFLNKPGRPGPDYETFIQPLLSNMVRTFNESLANLTALAPRVAPEAASLFADVVDSLEAMVHRCDVVASSFDAVWNGHSNQTRLQRLSDARAAVEAAGVVIARRESHYRVPVDRVAGWRAGPTSYGWGYLWEVHSNYFNWRDFAIAEAIVNASNVADAAFRLTPCYLNVQEVADVAFGEGWLDDIAKWVRDTFGAASDKYAGIIDCLAQPEAELEFPRDL